MKSAIFLSAREKATRLPHKALRLINGRTVTEHLIDRLKLCTEPDQVVLTTSTHSSDEGLCTMAREAGIEVFRGSEDDKLVRYRDAARTFSLDFIVVVDGDDILCSEEHIDRAFVAGRETGADYVTQEGLPLGAASFGLGRDAVERVCEVKAARDTEVWGEYFTRTGLFSCHFIDEQDPTLRRPDIRMTLDYEEDLRFFTAVIEAFAEKGRPLPPFRDVMQFLSSRPDIVGLNAGVSERYAHHLAKSAPVQLKEEYIR